MPELFLVHLFFPAEYGCKLNAGHFGPRNSYPGRLQILGATGARAGGHRACVLVP